MIWGSEGRKVGSLKRRVRSQLARWEMNKCTPLWHEAHFQVKMLKTLGVRNTFESSDVEKVHAVVARSTFWSEHVQNKPGPDHFWELRCWKSARLCGAKHISKSKCTKHTRSGPLLKVQMSKKWMLLWREAHFRVKMCKTPHVRATFGGSDVASLRSTTLHSTTLHYTTLHYATLHNTTTTTTQLHSTTLNYTTLRYITLHCTPLHYSPLHCTTLHYTTFHYTSLHYTTLHYNYNYNYNYRTTLQYTPLHPTKLNYTTLHYTALHYTTLHYTPLHYLPLHCTTLHYTPLHYNYNYDYTTTLHSTTLRYTTLHCATLHYTEWHCTTDRQVDR